MARRVQALFYPSKSKVSVHVVCTLGHNYKQKLETPARTFSRGKNDGFEDIAHVQNPLLTSDVPYES